MQVLKLWLPCEIIVAQEPSEDLCLLWIAQYYTITLCDSDQYLLFVCFCGSILILNFFKVQSVSHTSNSLSKKCSILTLKNLNRHQNVLKNPSKHNCKSFSNSDRQAGMLDWSDKEGALLQNVICQSSPVRILKGLTGRLCLIWQRGCNALLPQLSAEGFAGGNCSQRWDSRS